MVGACRPVILVLAVIAVWAVAATPAWAEQVTCGQVLTKNTKVENDLDCKSESPALVIGAPGITLDLGGHSLSTYREVIVNEGYDNVTIKNGIVNGELAVIMLTGVEHNEIRNVRVGGLVLGIVVEDSDHNRFIDNVVSSASFTLTRSDWNTIRGNVVLQYEGRMSLSDSSHNRVVDNDVETEEGGFGLAAGSTHNRIAHNNFGNSSLYGGSVASIISSDDNEFVDNVVSSIPEFGRRALGLHIGSSSRNRVLRNRFLNSSLGVRLESGADNVLNGNLGVGVFAETFTSAEPDGFRVEAPATGTLLKENSVSGFRDDGFDIEAPGTRLRRNTAYDNLDLGFEAVPGIIDLGGNTAGGNGNPLQCLNVGCG